MSIISRLSVVLGLDTAEFNQGIGKAEQGVNKFSGVAAGMKTAVLAAAAAYAAASYKAIEFADSINDLAKANDMAASNVIEMSKALSLNGGSIDSTSKILASFTNKVDEAAEGSQKTRDKFKELGVSIKDIGTLSEDELLRKTVSALAKIEDPIRRNALAFELLGKGVKGVDLKGFNDELQRTKGTSEASNEAFGKIGDAMDKIDKLSFQIKEDLANNIADPFYEAAIAAEKFYQTLREQREQNKQDGEKARKQIIGDLAPDQIPQWWKGVFGPTFRKELEQAEKQVNVFSAKMQEKIIPSIIGNGLTRNEEAKPVRETKISDEQQKILDKITAQKTALAQNLMTMERQTSEIGRSKLLYDEMLQQFEKGGKYDLIKDEALKNRLLNLAREYDIAKLTYESDKKRGEAILAFNEQGKELQRQTIQRNRDQAVSAELQVKEIENLTRRAEYEREIANLSDTQRERALEYYDLKVKIVQMGQDPLWTDEQISKIETANQKMIEANTATQRYENTFSVGFNRAFENFKERASDSFGAGQAAFQSMTSNMESALDKFVQTGKLNFGELAASIIQDLIKIQLKAQATSLFSSIFGDMFGGLFGGGGKVTGTTNVSSGIKLSGFADGGEPPVGRASIVGERGPELFIPKTSGTIIPNHSLSSMTGNQPQTIYNGPYIENLSAIDTQSAAQFLARNKDSVWAANQSAQRSLPMSRA